MNRNENSEKEQELRIETSIQDFTDLLTKFASPDEIKQKLSELYFNYSRFVVQYRDNTCYDSPIHLFYLWQLIGILGYTDLSQDTDLKKAEELRIQGCIKAFKTLITGLVAQDEIKQVFINLYFNYTEFVIRYPNGYSYDCIDHLFYLKMMIGILDNTYSSPQSITESQKIQLNNLFQRLHIKSPETTILEISEKRTTQVDEMSFFEAETLLDRFNKVDQHHVLMIKASA